MVYGGDVPRRSDIPGPPRDFVQGRFLEDDAEIPIVVRYAQELARSLHEAIGPLSLRYVARRAKLDHTTIAAVLSGSRWPDLVTIAKLEQALGKRLWPDLVD